MQSAHSMTVNESLAYVTHEMNQPLAAVVMSAEIALEWLTRDPPNLDQARQAIARVIGNSQRVVDVARSARDQVSQLPIVESEFDFHGAIESALEFRKLDLARARVAVQTVSLRDRGLVRGDRLQLERLLSNLIGNAIDAMSEVTGRSRRLRIGTDVGTGGELQVTVADSGTGIDSAAAERIFDPFFTTKSRGMGLGLPICRSIVESHGGRLWVTPNNPHGCTFTFTLPALA